MFINLSNHPFSSWSAKQLEAAKQYGDLAEMAFPNIESNCSTEVVRMLATAYVTDIMEHYPAENLTVHIMGEQTFCYHVVRQLKQRNVRCVASTTERIVKEIKENKRIVEFTFVQFREY